MSVYESRYRPLTKRTRDPPKFWEAVRVMVMFEIRKGLEGRWAKVPLIFAGFFLFFSLTSLTGMLTLPEKDFVNNVEFFSSFFLTPREGPGSLIWLHVAIINSGLIASDLSDNTFTLYMTKMRLRVYFLSKFIASVILTLIGLPLVGLSYFFIAIYKRGLPIFPFNWDLMGQYAIILGKLLLFIAFEVIFYASVILLFSAYTKKAINAGVLFIVYLIASSVIFEGILVDATQVEWFKLLSPLSAMLIVFTNYFTREVVFGGSHDGSDQFPIQDPESPSLYWESVGVTLFYAILALILTYRKLQDIRRE